MKSFKRVLRSFMNLCTSKSRRGFCLSCVCPVLVNPSGETGLAAEEAADVAPFALCKREVGEHTSGDDSGKYIPVEVNQVSLIKAEDCGRIAVLKHMLRGHDRVKDEID